MISYVLEMIAQLKGVSREKAEQVTWENALTFYGLSDKRKTAAMDLLIRQSSEMDEQR